MPEDESEDSLSEYATWIMGYFDFHQCRQDSKEVRKRTRQNMRLRRGSDPTEDHSIDTPRF